VRAESKIWADRFEKDEAGNDVALGLEKIVEKELPTYEYLRQFKLQV